MKALIEKLKSLLTSFRADMARSMEIAKSLGVDKLDDVKLSTNKAGFPVARAVKTGDVPVSDAIAKEIRQLNTRLALGRSMTVAGIPLGTLEQMARLCESQAATLEGTKAAKAAAAKAAKAAKAAAKVKDITVSNGTVIPSRQTALATA
tara:strand:+ start:193 stop:639 length:447 start_codon:yes stop_codon:yes gene_type:complete